MFRELSSGEKPFTRVLLGTQPLHRQRPETVRVVLISLDFCCCFFLFCFEAESHVTWASLELTHSCG